MKHWPHVEVIHPQEKLGGFWPKRKRPSSDDDLSHALNEARLQGCNEVVLKAEYSPAYRPTGPRRLVLRGVPGISVGSVRAAETDWTFVAVSCVTLRRYLKARRPHESAA